MRRLIVLLLILIFSVWFGLEIVRHPGYLLLVYQPWMVQMPVWFALISLFIIFGLFYLLIDSIDRIQFLFYRLKNWLYFRREHQSYSKTQFGLAALIEGRWKKAERLLLAGVNQAIDPLINYLAAAKAAHEQGGFDRRDLYIKKAYAVAPKADLAIGLTQAELELNQGHFEQAQATLNRLLQSSPRHPRVLKLLEKVYIRLSDFKNLQMLIPNMRKAKVLDAQQAELFEKNIYCEILNSPRYKNLMELQAIWQDIPRSFRKNPDVLYAYANQILQFDFNTIDAKKSADLQNEIEDLIRKTLNEHWHAGLVNLYGTLPFKNLNRQLIIVGAWLKMYGQRPELLLLLGRLCVKVQLWGKAKDYYEKCLAEGPNAVATFEYGQLLEQLGENHAAMQAYKDGLAKLCNQ